MGLVDGLKWKGLELGKRAREDPRLRHFPLLGYSIVMVPVDVMPYRGAARMMIGTMYGFEPDELIDLRARRHAMEGEAERTWWVMAIPQAAVDRRSRPARKRRHKKAKKAE
jgi:hypothetical protein